MTYFLKSRKTVTQNLSKLIQLTISTYNCPSALIAKALIPVGKELTWKPRHGLLKCQNVKLKKKKNKEVNLRMLFLLTALKKNNTPFDLDNYQFPI